jgi:lipid-binding SYLF domain-containing protein
MRGSFKWKGHNMMKRLFSILAMVAIALAASSARADEYQDTINVFRKAVESSALFDKAYGYAVFPTIGKAGVGLGGAFGKGHVYEKGKYIGDTSMTQVSVGWQLGGEGFSQIIFFEDKRALDEFKKGNFEFSAEASAVAITAAAGGQATTTGSSAGASAGQHDAKAVGKYHKGTAIFTVAKGGLMYQATVAGQKFTFKPH